MLEGYLSDRRPLLLLSSLLLFPLPSFEGVCLTHVILAPGACGTGGPSCRCERRFRGIRRRVPKSLFWSNPPQLLAALGTPKRLESTSLTNTPSLLLTLGTPQRPKKLVFDQHCITFSRERHAKGSRLVGLQPGPRRPSRRESAV